MKVGEILKFNKNFKINNNDLKQKFINIDRISFFQYKISMFNVMLTLFIFCLIIKAFASQESESLAGSYFFRTFLAYRKSCCIPFSSYE